ncbi:unnamed protein product [Cyprideis torosa]|uniref:Uncharacterized protein n=1 Tax=Cyprideis torosa TaxID=163714 RepID=A0A7R8ZLX9_9CRUS|nr:unnamed protein product [Cyprideis torosa]CAG0892901.1 unnamed protein product [Cyprideis torosa]
MVGRPQDLSNLPECRDSKKATTSTRVLAKPAASQYANFIREDEGTCSLWMRNDRIPLFVEPNRRRQVNSRNHGLEARDRKNRYTAEGKSILAKRAPLSQRRRRRTRRNSRRIPTDLSRTVTGMLRDANHQKRQKKIKSPKREYKPYSYPPKTLTFWAALVEVIKESFAGFSTNDSVEESSEKTEQGLADPQYQIQPCLTHNTFTRAGGEVIWRVSQEQLQEAVDMKALISKNTSCDAILGNKVGDGLLKEKLKFDNAELIIPVLGRGTDKDQASQEIVYNRWLIKDHRNDSATLMTRYDRQPIGLDDKWKTQRSLTFKNEKPQFQFAPSYSNLSNSSFDQQLSFEKEVVPKKRRPKRKHEKAMDVRREKSSMLTRFLKKIPFLWKRKRDPASYNEESREISSKPQRSTKKPNEKKSKNLRTSRGWYRYGPCTKPRSRSVKDEVQVARRPKEKKLEEPRDQELGVILALIRGNESADKSNEEKQQAKFEIPQYFLGNEPHSIPKSEQALAKRVESIYKTKAKITLSIPACYFESRPQPKNERVPKVTEDNETSLVSTWGSSQQQQKSEREDKKLKSTYKASYWNYSKQDSGRRGKLTHPRSLPELRRHPGHSWSLSNVVHDTNTLTGRLSNASAMSRSFVMPQYEQMIKTVASDIITLIETHGRTDPVSNATVHTLVNTGTQSDSRELTLEDRGVIGISVGGNGIDKSPENLPQDNQVLEPTAANTIPPSKTSKLDKAKSCTKLMSKECSEDLGFVQTTDAARSVQSIQEPETEGVTNTTLSPTSEKDPKISSWACRTKNNVHRKKALEISKEVLSRVQGKVDSKGSQKLWNCASRVQEEVNDDLLRTKTQPLEEARISKSQFPLGNPADTSKSIASLTDHGSNVLPLKEAKIMQTSPDGNRLETARQTDTRRDSSQNNKQSHILEHADGDMLRSGRNSPALSRSFVMPQYEQMIKTVASDIITLIETHGRTDPVSNATVQTLVNTGTQSDSRELTLDDRGVIGISVGGNGIGKPPKNLPQDNQVLEPTAANTIPPSKTSKLDKAKSCTKLMSKECEEDLGFVQTTDAARSLQSIQEPKTEGVTNATLSPTCEEDPKISSWACRTKNNVHRKKALEISKEVLSRVQGKVDSKGSQKLWNCASQVQEEVNDDVLRTKTQALEEARISKSQSPLGNPADTSKPIASLTDPGSNVLPLKEAKIMQNSGLPLSNLWRSV